MTAAQCSGQRSTMHTASSLFLTNTEEQMKTEAAGKIAEADAEKTELAYDFDVNLSGTGRHQRCTAYIRYV